ncbi:NlpC/P60 family protein [Streptomyces sp. NPDC051567]|uniref:NlpC/P60 family protein n=1 Tax=Streptomyces sp. NPDC051567 TaxID=3365660 RepID=UPI0037B04333
MSVPPAQAGAAPSERRPASVAARSSSAPLNSEATTPGGAGAGFQRPFTPTLPNPTTASDADLVSAARKSALLLSPDRSATASPVTRGEVIRRAQTWVDARVPYSMTAYRTDQNGRYRTDCSGFVSMAWQLPASGANNWGETTGTLVNFTRVIAKEELKPGDVLNNPGGGATGHVVIFNGWANAAHTAYDGLEQAGSTGAIRRNIPYPYFSGNGTFTPRRYHNIVDDITAPAPTSDAPQASVYNPHTRTAEIFAVAENGSMVHNSNTNGAGWSGWTTLGTSNRFKGAPVAEFNPATNALELFALGTDNSVWHTYYQNGWSTWSVMGTGHKFTSTPTAEFNPATNALELFALGADSSVWHAYYQNGWSGWSVMGAGHKFSATPSAEFNPATNALELFALGADNRVWHAYYQNGWSTWSVMGTAKFKGVPVAEFNPATNALELFALGTDSSVWHAYHQNGWSGWSVMGAGHKFSATPTAVFNPSTNALELFALGTDRSIWHIYHQNGWSAWNKLGNGPYLNL